jgi:sucrose synthase
MDEELKFFISENCDIVYLFFREIKKDDRNLLLQSDVIKIYNSFINNVENNVLKNSIFENFIYLITELIIRENSFFMSVRDDVGSFLFYQYNLDSTSFEKMCPSSYLFYKETLIKPNKSSDDWTLEIDITPFNREFPKLKEPKTIGKGVEFLNRHLASRLFFDMGQGSRLLLNFLKVHKYRETQLMISSSINSIDDLRKALRRAIYFLNKRPIEESHRDVERFLKTLGFEAGWGNSVYKIKNTMELLVDLLEAPEPQLLEEFLSRIPMIFNIAILSPHGYFAQANVLGKPDTGGQVVYILNQVRALEKELIKSIHEQGLDIDPKIIVVTRLIPEAIDTTCNLYEEKIFDTKFAKIIRVPFRYKNGEIVNQWIPRFHVWPYLEQFAIEAEKVMLAELGNKPDLIIGNYSDGSLVSFILSKRLGVTNCMIAHALEKTKYLFSDLYWRNNEEQYRFSSQFTADLISMNSTDFIITSTYQEIAGVGNTMGQYESYKVFTMPDLYRVVNGIDLYDPKFNIVSPGADENVYFPYYEKEKRLAGIQEEIYKLIYSDNFPQSRGNYANKEKPIIFALSRIDYIKNITGLVKWFTESETLRNTVNLLIVSTIIDPSQSKDKEEESNMREIHRLIDEYNLTSTVRWVGGVTDKRLVGELYRYIADLKGAFVQPALFEAFGLTVIEAMISGLPTFATKYGGPLEIIENGFSGFHIDPNNAQETSNIIVEFFRNVQMDSSIWYNISENAIKRVKEKYSWPKYSKNLLKLSKIYGFWKYTTNLEREGSKGYFDMFYSLMLRRLAKITDI